MGSEFQGKQINSFRDLHVWQRAIELVVECYRLSASFPDSERFGLSNQFRRSAVSVPSNIAEGHSRGSTKAFLNFLWIANGSLSELETQLVLAVELGFVSHEDARTAFGLSNEVGRMLTGLRRSLS
ncbi:MAG TPA: four helix bundle protein [Planctomycetaceae bacterium]|nr:four helix bundle protein [Planctomycetaceae bacterium]HRA86501.1 four helix bundle protein [Planctomycetaceae bacterium]